MKYSVSYKVTTAAAAAAAATSLIRQTVMP